MLKTTITGIPIHVTADRIVVQNGAAVDTYSRDYYRLPLEAERPPDPLRGDNVKTELEDMRDRLIEGRESA